MALPIALQLYTVREALKQDFDAGLGRVADIGFTHVEFAGLPRPAAEIRTLMDKLGLKACGAHVGIEQFQRNFDQVVSDARTLGYDTVAVPWIGEEWRSAEGWRKLARVFNELGSKCSDKGLTFCYHNHSFEFARLDNGRTGQEILFNETDPNHVHAELDCYWVKYADHDIEGWMKKLAGRVPLLHIKDMTVGEKATGAGQDRKMTEVGTGTIDYRSVVELAPNVGVRFIVVEQDSGWIDNDSLKSARISFENLRKIVG